MAKYHVIGGKKVQGDVLISGAKNAALPILAAAVLNGGVSVIKNCPDISDVRVSVDILRKLGAYVDCDGNTLIIESKDIGKTAIDRKLMEKMRSSVIFAGSLIARCGEAAFFAPGGCALGKRPIDMHIGSFKKMGIDVREENGEIICGKNKEHDCIIELPVPSVGATENIMLASCIGKSITRIKNAAAEPEIADLQNFINSMGGKIVGAGSSEITIYGCEKLHDCEYSVMSDRIEEGTFMCMAAITGGELNLKNISGKNKALEEVLCGVGCDISHSGNELRIKTEKMLKGGLDVKTGYYPQFPTDMQPQITALLTLCRGESRITENIFESRDRHIDELIKMGADIKKRDSRNFTVKGTERLNAAKVCARDLRGGAALVAAAMSAEGESIINDIEYIQRGYEKFEDKLKNIGVSIKTEKEIYDDEKN